MTCIDLVYTVELKLGSAFGETRVRYFFESIQLKNVHESHYYYIFFYYYISLVRAFDLLMLSECNEILNKSKKSFVLLKGHTV